MTKDRERMITSNLRNSQLEDRLQKLEYLMSVSDSRPKIFEDIYNQMADIRIQQKIQETDLMQRLDLMQIKLTEMSSIVDDCSRLTQFLNEKSDSFDQLMSSQRQAIVVINEKLVKEFSEIENNLEEKFKELKSDIKKTDTMVTLNSLKVREFSDIIDRIEGYQREQNKELCIIKKQVLELKEYKLDQTIFEEGFKELREQVITIKYATQDNFRSLLATDNYLEKYLPFFIQGMISESVLSFAKPGQVQQLKEFEHTKYREWHKNALNDNGIPSLQKRGFKLPGQRQVVNNNNMDFIQELGEHVVSMEWFLSRDAQAVVQTDSRPSSVISESNRGSARGSGRGSTKALDPPPKHQQLLEQPQPTQQKIVSQERRKTVKISFKSSATNLKSHTSSKGNTTPRIRGKKAMPSQQISERGLDKLKVDYLMGMEDLEPELAEIVQEAYKLGIHNDTEIDRIKKEMEALREKMKDVIKEESAKLKQEVKSAFMEQLAFIQEMHQAIESEAETRRKERNKIQLEFNELQSKFSSYQLQGGNLQSQPPTSAKGSRKEVEELRDAVRLQNILNHEWFKIIFLPFVSKEDEKIKIEGDNLRGQFYPKRIKTSYQSTRSPKRNIPKTKDFSDGPPTSSQLEIKSDLTTLEVNTQLSHPTPPLTLSPSLHLDKKIDCYKIIQMIDSLIKGADPSTLTTLAERVHQTHTKLRASKAFRNSFVSDTLHSPHNELMMTGLTSIDRSDDLQYQPQCVKSGNSSIRREEPVKSLNSTLNEMPRGRVLNQRTGNQFMIRKTQKVMSPNNEKSMIFNQNHY